VLQETEADGGPDRNAGPVQLAGFSGSAWRAADEVTFDIDAKRLLN